MVIPIFVISLATSILVELSKVFPSITKTVERKRVTAFIIAILISIIYFFSADISALTLIELVALILGTTFIIYKALVQPVVNIVIDPIKTKLKATPIVKV